MLATMVVALATPGPVAGLALVLAYRDWPALYDSSAMIVMAQALRALPYVLLVLWPFLRSFPQDYLDAAALDGYGPLGQMFRVAFPLSFRAILAAWAVALAPGTRRAARDQPGLSARRRTDVGLPLGPAAHGRREPPLGRGPGHARRDRDRRPDRRGRLELGAANRSRLIGSCFSERG